MIALVGVNLGVYRQHGFGVGMASVLSLNPR
jgi:hypothetical protein